MTQKLLPNLLKNSQKCCVPWGLHFFFSFYLDALGMLLKPQKKYLPRLLLVVWLKMTSLRVFRFFRLLKGSREKKKKIVNFFFWWLGH